MFPIQMISSHDCTDVRPNQIKLQLMEQGRDLSAILRAMVPLVLASELAWGDEVGPKDAGHDAGGLSPVALRPLSRMSEEEKQV